MRGYARALRQRATDAEKLLWSRLRGRRRDGVKFKHSEQLDGDARRTDALQKSGYHVIRFWNNDVLNNIEGVIEAILQELHLTD